MDKETKRKYRDKAGNIMLGTARCLGREAFGFLDVFVGEANAAITCRPSPKAHKRRRR